jgi:hypothetical protein
MNDVMIEAEGLAKRYRPTEAMAGHDAVRETKAVRA